MIDNKEPSRVYVAKTLAVIEIVGTEKRTVYKDFAQSKYLTLTYISIVQWLEQVPHSGTGNQL